MLYYEFNVGNDTYKLRLNTRNLVSLEKTLGCNPLSVFNNGGIPTITNMVAIFHSSLQQYQHNISIDKAYEIFDKWLEDGNLATDFIPHILEIYKVSGLVNEDTENVDEKN